MKTVNVHQAKTNLSRLLADIEENGARFVICRNGAPIAELSPHRPRREMRPDRKLASVRIRYDPTEGIRPENWPEPAG